MTAKKPRPVCVTWLDAWVSDGRYTSSDFSECCDPQPCDSYGLLVYRDEFKVCIAALFDSETEVYRDVIAIPAVLVLKVRFLR